jgi:Family of unknown function (DUF6776)
MKVRVTLLVATACLLAAMLYLSFELGRQQSGYSLIHERRERQLFEAERAARDQTIDRLERELAILETSRDIDAETYAGITANLAELEARLQAQEEELAFYRGIVSPGDGVAGFRIQSVAVEPGVEPATFTLHITLVQAIMHNDRLAGAVRATLRGTEHGQDATYALAELDGASRSAEIPYEFRYFQLLEAGLALPEGFEPSEIEIEVWPQSPRGETIVQSFPWAVAPG